MSSNALDPMASFLCEVLEGTLTYRCCVGRQKGDDFQPYSEGTCEQGRRIGMALKDLDIEVKPRLKRTYARMNSQRKAQGKEEQPRKRQKKGKSPYSAHYGREYGEPHKVGQGKEETC